MNKEQLAIDIVYAQDKDLDLTPEYWEKKISTLLKAQRQEIIKKLDQLSLCMGNEWLEGERYYAVQTLIKTLINKQR